MVEGPVKKTQWSHLPIVFSEEDVDLLSFPHTDALRVLWFDNRIVVPKDHQLRKQILDEAHLSKFSIHPGSTKMYQDLRQNYW